MDTIKTVYSLTPEEVRRELARCLGYKYEKKEYWDTFQGQNYKCRPGEWIMTYSDGYEFNLRVNDKCAESEFWSLVPDWTDDSEEGTGAALTVCIEIATRHNWYITIEPVGKDTEVRFYRRTADGNDHMEHLYIANYPSLALARLALAALLEETDE